MLLVAYVGRKKHYNVKNVNFEMVDCVYLNKQLIISFCNHESFLCICRGDTPERVGEPGGGWARQQPSNGPL